MSAVPRLRFLVQAAGALKRRLVPDFVVVNGENATGRGITPAQADDMFFAGADVITLGNHAFDNRQILPYLDDVKPIVRPYNPGPGPSGARLRGRRVQWYARVCGKPFGAASYGF